jgi:hypothetical protein
VITILSFIAVGIIAALSVYAAILVRKVKVQQLEHSKKEAEEQAKNAKQREYIIESLNVIAANVLDEGLNLSEATIRSKILLDALIVTPEQRQPFAVLDEVFEQIGHFATHNARKALKRSEIMQQDSQREAVEEKYAEALKDCFNRLRQFRDPKN